jgi:hypothetical protein
VTVFAAGFVTRSTAIRRQARDQVAQVVKDVFREHTASVLKHENQKQA